MRKATKVISIIILFAILTCALGACNNNPGSSADKQVVKVLSANYEEQILVQLDYLKKLYPDASIEMTYMSSGKLAAKVLAEGRDTEYDILLSLSSGYANQLKKENLLLAYTPENEYKPEYADADKMILPNGVWCGAILVNTQELANLNLPEPTSYEDLLNPIYHKHIVMANPNSSSTGYFFLLGILNLYGEEAGWEYFDKLKENIMLFGESGSVPSSMVEKGEAAIGLGIDYEGMALEADGKPVKVLFAQEGAPFDYDTVLLVNRKEAPSPFVMDIMKVITSIEGNAVFNNYNMSVLKDGADRGNYPDSFKTLDMTGIADAELKSTLSAKWSEKYD